MMDGTTIRSARMRRGWSQTQLLGALRAEAARDGIALMTPVSLRVALSRWENGHSAPDHLHRRLLRNVLDLHSDGDGPALVDGTLFGILQNHTNSLRILDRRFGAPAARLQSAAHVEAMESMLREARGADRIMIARAQADAAALAAWQDFDIGDVGKAREHYAMAQVAADRADDAVLLAHAIGEESVVLAETGQTKVALAQVERAQRLLGLPPLLRSWLSATRAQIAAPCLEMSGVARSALDTAEVLLPDRPSEEPGLPFLAHDTTHLARWTGHILALLGDSAAAAITRASMCVIPDGFVRARCGQQLDLVESAISMEDEDEALSLLAPIGDQISVLGSGRFRRRHGALLRRCRGSATAG